LNLLNKSVTVVELADRVLSSAFDRPAGKIVARKMKANGIDVINEESVVRIEGEGSEISGVTLKSGDFIACDTVVVAIGVRPAASYLKGSDIVVNRGIVVDNNMCTSVKDVYSAGDVAEAADFFSGQKNPMPIWPDAYIQGDIAGTAMAGGSKEYSGGLAMNSIEFFKVSTISMGVTNPKDPDEYEIHSFQDIQNYQYRKIVLKNNQLVGAVLVGSVDRAGIFAGLIREKVDMTPFKESLLLPDFGFVNLSREIRNRLFGPLGKTVDSGQARKSAGH
jgi:NAD(P)H-nitrite reductase large subunit